MEPIRDKVAIVTGASKGMGREITRSLALEGANVVAAARSSEAINALVAEIDRDGGRVIGREVDVSDPAQCKALVEWTIQQMGRLDILVNNAGLGFWSPVESMTDENWLQTMRVNVDAVFYLCRAAIAPMRHTGGGRIVNIGSSSGRRGVRNMAAYSASKAALINFSEALAQEVKEYGIQVSIVSPGVVDTEFRADHRDQGRPLGPSLTDPNLMLAVSDVASAVVWALKADRTVAATHISLEPRG